MIRLENRSNARPHAVDDFLLLVCLAFLTAEPGIYVISGRDWTEAELVRFHRQVRESHRAKINADQQG